MPMDRRLYPECWDRIALLVKIAAGWHCQECGRPCFWPNESVEEFWERVEIELLAENTPDTNEWVNQFYQGKPGRLFISAPVSVWEDADRLAGQLLPDLLAECDRLGVGREQLGACLAEWLVK